jgi:hypothetical protein
MNYFLLQRHMQVHCTKVAPLFTKPPRKNVCPAQANLLALPSLTRSRVMKVVCYTQCKQDSLRHGEIFKPVANQ